MLKFTLASRHMDEGTRDRFFYEWSIMHVSLMLTTPSVMQLFKRYVQHFNIADVTNDMLVYPLSAEGWESFAEHWVDSYQGVIDSVHNREYVERMQPHRFGSHRFITSVSDFETIYQRNDFRSGGVKLIHFLKKSPGISQSDFNQRLRSVRAPRLLDDICAKGLVRKYVQNTLIDIDPAIFKGSLFEFGSIGLYAGIEEFWFDDIKDVARLRTDPRTLDAIRSTEAGLIDVGGSISMMVKERVVWDFVTAGELSPSPSILNPNSLEAAIDRQGYQPWELKPRVEVK
jgi:EthD domain